MLTVITLSSLLVLSFGDNAAFHSNVAQRSAFGVPILLRMSTSEKELPQMVNLAEKYFQLAELEDSESWETEVLLKADQTIHVGETDGPLFKTASGTWLQDEHGRFEMSLSRRYDAGHEKRKTTDVGEFDFEVGRVYSGELSYVGASIAVSGSIHIIDEKLGNEEVGFFNLIDTTSSRRNMDS